MWCSAEGFPILAKTRERLLIYIISSLKTSLRVNTCTLIFDVWLIYCEWAMFAIPLYCEGDYLSVSFSFLPPLPAHFTVNVLFLLPPHFFLPKLAAQLKYLPVKQVGHHFGSHEHTCSKSCTWPSNEHYVVTMLPSCPECFTSMKISSQVLRLLSRQY